MLGLNFALSKMQPQLKWSNLMDNAVVFPAMAGSNTFYTEALDLYTTYDSLGNRPYDLFSPSKNILNTSAGVYIRSENIIDSDDVSSNTATDVAAVFTKSFATNDHPGGKGNKVVITQLKRTPPKWGDGTPQVWQLTIGRYLPNNPLPALTYKFSMKVPSNLSEILTHTNPSLYPAWFECLAFKGTTDNNNTQHRISIQLVKQPGETGMRFLVRFDLFNKDLNGNALPVSATTPTFLWDMKSAEGSLIAGDTYDVYFHFDQRTPSTDLTGVVKILIINTSKNTVAMNDMRTGVATCGYDAAPVGRLYFFGLYTGGFPASGNIQIEYGNLMFWSPYAPPVRMTSTPS